MGESVKKASVQAISENVSPLEFLLRILLELLLIELCTTSHFTMGLKRSSKKPSRKSRKRTRFPQLAVLYFEAIDLELSFFFSRLQKKIKCSSVWFSFGICHCLPGHAVPRLQASSSAHWHTLVNNRKSVQVTSLSTTQREIKQRRSIFDNVSIPPHLRWKLLVN